jgi:hypothetical protein
LVPPLIADPTSRNNIGSAIRASILTSLEMLSGALKMSSLLQGNAVFQDELFRIFQPHRTTAVAATTRLVKISVCAVLL